jgi:hypothetical protein
VSDFRRATRERDEAISQMEQAQVRLAQLTATNEELATLFTRLKQRDNAEEGRPPLTRAEVQTGTAVFVTDGALRDDELRRNAMWIMGEWSRLLAIESPSQRRYTERVYEFAYVLYQVSHSAFDFLGRFLRLPSAEAIRVHYKDELKRVKEEVTSLEALPGVLRAYREQNHIAADVRIRVVIGCDATSANRTGLLPRAATAKAEGIMAFVLMPLDHKYRDLVVFLEPTLSSRIMAAVGEHFETIAGHCEHEGFEPMLVATDGDIGIDALQREAAVRVWLAMQRERDNELVGARLEAIIRQLLDSGEMFRLWPVSDFLHLLKNLRARLMLHFLRWHGGSVPLHGPWLDMAFRAAGLGAFPGLGPDIKTTKMQDGPAIAMVMPGLMLQLLHGGAFDAARLFAPWTCLDLALANEELDVPSRLGLIQLAFSLFVWADEAFPDRSEVPERASGVMPITPYTRNQLNRAMNLCVALQLTIELYPSRLALGRVGSHSLECHFGMVRAVLRADDRWDRWLSAEAHAILVQRFLDELGVPPMQRRSRSAISGVVLSDGDNGLLSLELTADAAISIVEEWAAGDVGRFVRLFEKIDETLPECRPRATGNPLSVVGAYNRVVLRQGQATQANDSVV